jgi:hypothetical protein
MSLKVIGAGFGRTGTLSLKQALEQLGFEPCYHMIETRRRSEHDALWLAIARGDSDDWRTILAGYAACVDWPGVYIWKQLVTANRQAKVILTVRDPERWYASAAKTIFARMQGFADALARGDADAVDPVRRAHMTMVNRIVVDNTFGGRLDKAYAIAVFNAHNEEVRRTVLPEQLLSYESGEGWDRLCSFLDVPKPQAPYPKINSAEEFATRFP